MRLEFTHLDPHLILDLNLSQDLFFEQYVLDDLVKLLDSRKSDEKVMAKTEFMFVMPGGQYELRLVDVEVTGYEPAFRVFNLENRAEGVVTTRSRFNLKLSTDPDDWIEQNRNRIDYWRDLSQQYLRVQRLINAEMLSRYANHSMAPDLRRRILKLVGDINQYDRELVERSVIQIEALYVYALLKSTLSSQRNDPFVKNMLINF